MKSSLLNGAMAVLAFLLGTVAAVPAADKPNIILILSAIAHGKA